MCNSVTQWRFRRSFLPRQFDDYYCMFIIIFFLPPVVAFEWIVILPNLFDICGLWYWLNVNISLIMVLNIVTNLAYCMLIDTSAATYAITSRHSAVVAGWHHCTRCQRYVPPRAWHCKVCGVCILKRDHHCNFAANCIGFYNHRFFFMFLVHLFVYSVYTLAINIKYCQANGISFVRLMSTFGITSLNKEIVQLSELCMAVVFALNAFALLGSVFPLCTQTCALRYGGVFLLHGKPGYKDYDAGLYENLRIVFGERMGLVWLCPFINSDLPHNGISWQRKRAGGYLETTV